ncbi:DUF3710 domain-containing protein [Nocardioides sp. SYSU D00038]|uniref:DUF3710 domain-containing protein n=1 Tax=Nocardioides sp. SYSU D00038 TaxID=2812554 RepID=UPI0019688635|nr:DUF3710 domain-containing protein [Nocardioides sp. SYSU D00038]
MKFRRKNTAGPSVDEITAPADDVVEVPAAGPYDADELPADDPERIDLGSLLVAPPAGLELRLQVDEASQQVQAVLLASERGMIELRAFAAPRNGDLWGEVRPQIAADMSQRGGTATEQEGRFGPELSCSMTVTDSEGRTGTQPSRVVGINGPRWLLRATLLGEPAMDPAKAGPWEDALASVAVRRGEQALPPGEPLPVTMPPQARRVD